MVEVDPSLRSEDALAEEPGDDWEQVILADGEAPRMLGVPGLLAMMLRVGHARVVRGVLGAVVAGLADHPPVAQRADEIGAQQVAAPGLRVSQVRASPLSGALAQPGHRG